MFRACGEHTANLLSQSYRCSCVHSSADPVVSNAATPSSSCTTKVVSCSTWAAVHSQVDPSANSCSAEVALTEYYGGTLDEHLTAQALACAHPHSCGTNYTAGSACLTADQGSSLAASSLTSVPSCCAR